jgi:hypothetical protein
MLITPLHIFAVCSFSNLGRFAQLCEATNARIVKTMTGSQLTMCAILERLAGTKLLRRVRALDRQAIVRLTTGTQTKRYA